jgi:hypothetical protein
VPPCHAAYAFLHESDIGDMAIPSRSKSQSDKTIVLNGGQTGREHTHDKAGDVVVLGSGAGELIHGCHQIAKDFGGGGAGPHGEGGKHARLAVFLFVNVFSFD